MDRVNVDVCIVGAGYAGLLAARQLARAGKEVCVLEARDRVGGRIFSIERGGTRVDIGGAWLGAGQENMYGLAREYGVATHPTHDTGDDVIAIKADVRRFSSDLPRVSPVALASIALGIARLDLMAKRVPLDAPWDARRASTWDATSVGAWLARNVPPGAGRELLGAGVRGLMTCDPSEVSLLHFLYLVRSATGLQKLLAIKGGYQQDLVEGGAALIAERVAAELGERVRLASPVRAIAQTAGDVRVTSDLVEVTAARVIVTAPPALASRIAFTPALPTDREQLLDRMPAGAITKFIVMYPDAFWRRDGLSGTTIGMASPIESTFDAGPPSGTPGVVAAFAFGPHGRRLATFSADERRRTVIDALMQRLGAAAADPAEFVEQDWAAEEWSRGCFMAHLPPGVLTQYGRVIREPTLRVHWAGTETATRFLGTMEGAVRSAMRAADEVLAAL